MECDFTSDRWEEAVAEAVASSENVFHCAAEMPHRATCRWNKDVLWKVNVEGTEKLYALAKSAKRFLHASSISIYGDALELPADEDSEPAPGDFYALSKLEAERRLLRAAASTPAIPPSA